MVLAYLLALTAHPALADQPRLIPAPIESFDGKTWSGLKLGEMADKDLKKAFQTDRGAVRPEALLIATEKDSKIRVDALLDGRGDKALMQAIRVEYKDRAPNLSDLAKAWGEEPQPLYAINRTENWHVEIFPRHGVIVEAIGEGDVDATVFILTTPERARLAVREFDREPTRIVAPRDPGKDWERVATFRRASASVTLGDNKPNSFDKRWRDDLSSRLEDQAEDFRRGRLRYDRYSDGSLSIAVSSTKWKDTDTTFTVNVSLSLQTPYGYLSQSGSATRRMDSSHRRRVQDLLDDAMRELEYTVDRAMRKYGPDAIDKHRKDAVMAMYKTATS